MKRRMMQLTLMILLSACSGLPKLSLTPVNVDAQLGGERETGIQEDNVMKVDTGDTHQTAQDADLITNTTNQIQEYPLWLVLAFALSVGVALPSPLSAWSAWRQRRALERQVTLLANLLAASQPTSTTKPVGSLEKGNEPSLT